MLQASLANVSSVLASVAQPAADADAQPAAAAAGAVAAAASKPQKQPLTDAIKRRCEGTLGTWCIDFHTQAEVPAVTAPRGNRTCSLNCNQARAVAFRLLGLGRSIVGCMAAAPSLRRPLPWRRIACRTCSLNCNQARVLLLAGPGITCCCALLRWQLLAQPVCHHLAVCPPSAVASAPLCAPQVGTCSALTSLCTAFHPTPAASAFLLPFSYSPVPSAGRHVQRPDRPVHLPRGLAGLQLPHAHAAPLRQPLLLFWI